MASTYTGGDVAALLVLFCRNATATAGQFGSFEEQLKAASDISDNDDFKGALMAIRKVQADNPALIEAAHFAVRDVLLEVEKTLLWGSCKFVNPDHIRRICNL
jgi:hypothetical protein